APEGEASLILDRGILAERLSAQRVIAARLASQTASGWLFALDPRSPDADVMTLAEVAGRLVSASIDEQNVAAMMRDSAAASERLRLSRDLHDGLLQSLGGLALHAQAARRSLANDPASAETRLAVVVQSLTDAQRALRDFVDELRPELAARDSERVATTHGDVLALVSEGVANAVKHAVATKITCTIGLLENYIEIDIRDNGRGFPFEGRYDLAQLAELRRGPWSLKERVADRGGELVLDTTSAGTHIAIRLPC
ncbi:MAG: sensor histidine kinase, partial [Thermoanaerobaculia bacterium]